MSNTLITCNVSILILISCSKKLSLVRFRNLTRQQPLNPPTVGGLRFKLMSV